MLEFMIYKEYNRGQGDVLNKKNKYIAGIIIILAIIGVTFTNQWFFGTRTDWLAQHTVFPDYFRKLFYQTGNPLPSLALQLGAGQNIFNFSYYGLFNPFILLSYILPFLDMKTYISILNIILVIINFVLMYYFLNSKVAAKKIAIFGAFTFIFSTTMFHHASHHIMFVSYFPFLLLSLIGIDYYFKTHKRWLYVFGLFLCIMVSYYYVVGFVATLVIYYMYTYIKMIQKFNLKECTISFIKFSMPLLISACMSMVLVLPTLTVLLSGRDASTSTSVSTLLIPTFKGNELLYSAFGLGLTTIALFSLLIQLFSKKKAQIFLVITLSLILIVPIFSYILNGTLYLRNKGFIPLLPLYILIIGLFLDTIHQYRKREILLVGSTICIFLFMNHFTTMYKLDLLVTVVVIVLVKVRKLPDRIMYMLLVGIILWVNTTTILPYLNTNQVNKLANQDTISLQNFITKQDKTFYRINQYGKNSYYLINNIANLNYYGTSIYASSIHTDYRKLQDTVFNQARSFDNKLIYNDNNNIIFQTLMGVKYVITDTSAPVGYKAVKSIQNKTLYKNENVFSLGYSTPRVMSEKVFDTLDFAHQQEALLQTVITDHGNDYTSNLQAVQVDESSFELHQIEIENMDDTYYVKVEHDTASTIHIPLRQDEVLFVSFDLKNKQSCKLGNQRITIQDTTNILTCKSSFFFNDNTSFAYVISSNEDIAALQTMISKGTYEITNVKFYKLPYQDVIAANKSVDHMQVNVEETQGNTIKGNINVSVDGYFVLSIPYDEGYTIHMDGKVQKYQRVNKNMIGFAISKGNHDIKIVYEAPGLFTGLILSMVGGIVFMAMFVLENKKIVTKYREIMMYIIFGIATTFVNIGVYMFFSNILNINYLISNVIAFILSVTFAFITNKIYVFKQLDFSLSTVIQEVISFFSVRLASFGLDMLLLFILVSLLKQNELLAKIIINIIVIILNYVFSKFIVFRRNKNA